MEIPFFLKLLVYIVYTKGLRVWHGADTLIAFHTSGEDWLVKVDTVITTLRTRVHVRSNGGLITLR